MSRSWPRSNPLVTFEAWSWMDMFAFCFMAIGPLLVEIQEIPYLTLKCQGQGHGQGQIWWSHLRPRVQSICLLFVSWQSDDFWQRYSKFRIWPSKFKVKVMAKVKPNGLNWCLELNWYVCFSFRGDRTIFDWDIANSIFDLENSRSRSWSRSNLMVTLEAYISIDVFCSSFRGNRTIFGWDIANSIFDLENWRSRSRRKSTKI